MRTAQIRHRHIVELRIIEDAQCKLLPIGFVDAEQALAPDELQFWQDDVVQIGVCDEQKAGHLTHIHMHVRYSLPVECSQRLCSNVSS